MSDELQRVIEAKLWAENDRLHAEVERMKKELGEGGMSYSDGVERDRLFIENGQLRAEVERLEKERNAADLAIQRVAMALGSGDEWTDQATMIADFEERLRAEVERLKKELDEARAAVPIAYNRAFRDARARHATIGELTSGDDAGVFAHREKTSDESEKLFRLQERGDL